MFRFRPSMESLETRETPAGLASVTDMVIDGYNPAPSGDSYYGTGVYKSVDGGQTGADSGGVSGRVAGIVADPTDPAAGKGGTIDVYFHVIRHGSGVASGDDVVVDGRVITADAPDAASAVRPRMFAIVDRTQLGGTDGIWLDTDAPVQTATASKDMALKGQTIKENSTVGANGTITVDGTRTGDYSAVVFVGGWGSSGF